MGSPFNIVTWASDSTKAAKLAEQSFALVDSLNHIFSDYDVQSELSMLSATAGSDSFVVVSPALYDILLQSKLAWQRSKHSFDISIGALSKLWRNARKQKKFPTEQEVQLAKALTGFEKINIDTVSHAVELQTKGIQLDLGGIAKGYTAQKLIELLKDNGITSALVDAGGDIVAIGAPPGKKGWSVGINMPEATDQLLARTVTIKNEAVATSGDVYQFIEHDGKKYAHIINPATGYGVTFQRNVTVIASDGATADWLASACSILPIQTAKKLAKQMHAALLITHIENGKIIKASTKNFERYWRKE